MTDSNQTAPSVLRRLATNAMKPKYAAFAAAGLAVAACACSVLAATQSAAPASAPDLASGKLWPGLTGKEPFATETWPKARVMTWTKPGQGGDSACESEWAVMCSTHNLLKLYRSGKANWN